MYEELTRLLNQLSSFSFQYKQAQTNEEPISEQHTALYDRVDLLKEAIGIAKDEKEAYDREALLAIQEFDTAYNSRHRRIKTLLNTTGNLPGLLEAQEAVDFLQNLLYALPQEAYGDERRSFLEEREQEFDNWVIRLQDKYKDHEMHAALETKFLDLLKIANEALVANKKAPVPLPTI